MQLFGELEFTTSKPERNTSLHQGDRVQQNLGDKKTSGTRNNVKITQELCRAVRIERDIGNLSVNFGD